MESITNNRFSRYLIYAFGEIILVVAGILIALQINEWNSNRQLRKKEIGYLFEIRKNLMQDTTSINHVLLRNDAKLHCVANTFALFEMKFSSHEEMVYQFSDKMDTLSNFNIFIPEISAFNNMLSAENIDLISNQVLRQQLSSYYRRVTYASDTQERVKETTRTFNDGISPYLMNSSVLNNFFGINLSIVDEDRNSDLNTREVIGLLTGLMMSTRYQNYELGLDKAAAVELLESVEAELISRGHELL